MKKYFLLLMVLFTFVFMSVLADSNIVRPFAQTTTNQKWYVQRKWNKENVEWIDHTGRTNLAQRVIGSTTDVKGGDGHGKSIVLTSDLKVKYYTIDYANVSEGWSINNVAPGTYDFENGKWYTDMTDEEKTAMWVAYTNKVIQAELKREAERNAPAKFDVTHTPDEYMEFLLAGRELEDLAPEDQRDIRREFYKYRREWIRVNDPLNYDPPLPFMRNSGMTEQQKIRSRRGIQKR